MVRTSKIEGEDVMLNDINLNHRNAWHWRDESGVEIPENTQNFERVTQGVKPLASFFVGSKALLRRRMAEIDEKGFVSKVYNHKED